MPRRVFLSYPYDLSELEHEPIHEAIQAVCLFVLSKGCIISMAPSAISANYPLAQAEIEQCDAFVAVLDPIFEGSTQLLSYLDYAARLHRMRWLPRPRIFELWLGTPQQLTPILLRYRS